MVFKLITRPLVIQNATSTILKILIPVNSPRIPPVSRKLFLERLSYMLHCNNSYRIQKVYQRS